MGKKFMAKAQTDITGRRGGDSMPMCLRGDKETTALMHGWDRRNRRAGIGHAWSAEREEGILVVVSRRMTCGREVKA